VLWDLVRIPVPFTHEKGLIETRETENGGCQVRWLSISTFDWLPNGIAAALLEWLFTSMLNDTKKALE